MSSRPVTRYYAFLGPDNVLLPITLQVWRGVRRSHSGSAPGACSDSGQRFVLKRLMVEHGMEVW